MSQNAAPNQSEALRRPAPSAHATEKAARRAMRWREAVILGLITLMMIGAWVLTLKG